MALIERLFDEPAPLLNVIRSESSHHIDGQAVGKAKHHVLNQPITIAMREIIAVMPAGTHDENI